MSSSILFPGGSSAGLPSLFGGSAPAPVPATPVADPLAVSAITAPTASAAPAMPSSWDVLGHMAQGKSLPDAYAAASAQLPAPPPTPGPTSRVGDVLDSLFLDGAFRKTRTANYELAKDAYNTALARAGQVRQLGAIDSIQDPTARMAATLDPTDFVKEGVAKQFAPQTVAGGSTLSARSIMGGPDLAATAPLLSVDNQSGALVTQGLNDSKVTGFLPGAKSVDAGSGDVIDSRLGLTGQSAPQFHSSPVTDNAQFYAPDGSGPPAGAPMLGAGASVGSGPARGVRNNNLANVKALPNGQMWKGQTGTDSAGYAIFDTPANGQRAAMRNMASYARRDGVNTVNGFVERWASDSSAADKANYKATLSKALGVGPNDRIDLANPQTQNTIYNAQTPIESPGAGGASSGGVAPSRGGVSSGVRGRGVTLSADGTYTKPDGTPAAGPNFYGPQEKNSLYERVAKSDDYTQAQNASIAYKALTGNARTMTGPSAYAILDTFARAINPGAVARPQVIETIEKNLGPLNHVQGGWSSALGKGNLTPQVRQQVIDAVLPFVQSHWQAANALNQNNVATAQRHGFDPRDVTAPLDASPKRFNVNAGRFEPSAGDVEGGYRFNGGNPSDQRNWTKVR